MKAGIKIDTREFQKAMREYERATKKDGADILNRAGRNVAFRAAQFTDVASPTKIKSQLRSNNLLAKILAKRGRLKGLNMQERSALFDKVLSARMRSARYIRVGWAKAIAAFGGNATRMKVNPKSEAAKGYGIKASTRRLVAELANNSKGAEKVGLSPLERAIQFVARDMLNYAKHKMSRTGDKFSARGSR